ncbi:MAG: lipid III flippase WzxE [Arsenophonus sp. ER-LPS3-MAG3]
MSLAKTSIWMSISIFIKVITGLIIIKLLSVSFGPSGVGQVGNFRQLIIILSSLSGAGIFNGVIKYVAEYYRTPKKLSAVLGTSSSIILGFSVLLIIIFLFFSSFISFALFGHTRYQIVIYALAFIQIGIAYANYFLSILRGYRDIQGNAISIIVGNLVGIIIYYFCFRLNDYQWTLIGLALFPALTIIPSAMIIFSYKHFTIAYLKPCWDSVISRNLGKFTLMTLITSVTLPIAYIIMRNLLAKEYSWNEVGIWQAVSSISDIYLQFITISFNIYLLPTLAKLQDKNLISIEIFKTLKFILPIVFILSSIIWLFRDLIILLFFSVEFITMRDLFIWQLIGDVLKVSAYVFGYLIIAKAALYFYILTEIIQFILLIAFSYFLIPAYGALGAAQAYMITYIVYFILYNSIFYFYFRCK